MPGRERSYEQTGIVILDRLFGATNEYHESGLDLNSETEEYCRKLREQGAKLYFIREGGSTWVGALGHVNCALELCS